MNFAQVKDKAVDVLKTIGIITPGCSECSCHTDHSESFQAGAKAMFDSLMFRAANHYHGIPEIDRQCQKENHLVTEWAEDALMEVDPDSHFKWKSLDDMYESGYRAGLKAGIEESTERMRTVLHPEVSYTDGTFMGTGGT